MVPPIDQNGIITMYEVLYEPLETFSDAIGPLTMNVSSSEIDGSSDRPTGVCGL